jgi:hypothetical protein
MSSGRGLFSGMYPTRRLTASGSGSRPEAADRHLARRRGQVARQDAHRGRLAGAVGAEEADDLAARHREADVVDRRHAGVRLHEVGDLDRRLRGGFGHRGFGGPGGPAALLHRHLAGAEPARAGRARRAGGASPRRRPRDPAAPPAPALGERDLAAPQDVVRFQRSANTSTCSPSAKRS